MNIKFKLCPHCQGYGVLDNGNNCSTCGGVGRGRQGIGSGELMFDETGKQITATDLVEMSKRKESINYAGED